MSHLKKITWWQRHATPWERRLFLDSVHWQITSTYYTNQDTYKMTCDSKINLLGSGLWDEHLILIQIFIYFLLSCNEFALGWRFGGHCAYKILFALFFDRIIQFRAHHTGERQGIWFSLEFRCSERKIWRTRFPVILHIKFVFLCPQVIALQTLVVKQFEKNCSENGKFYPWYKAAQLVDLWCFKIKKNVIVEI